MKILKFFPRLFSILDGDFSSSQTESHNLQAFILEPILTPSALIDIGGEETPDLTLLESWDSNEIPFLNSEDYEIIEFIETEPFESGTFEVGETGEIAIEFLYDGGKYEGELGIFSLEGMEEFEPGSSEFVREAARRSLSDSEWGHIMNNYPSKIYLWPNCSKKLNWS